MVWCRYFSQKQGNEINFLNYCGNGDVRELRKGILRLVGLGVVTVVFEIVGGIPIYMSCENS